MTTANAPQELQTIAAALDSFEPTHMGGTNWSLVSKRTDGTWVINGDYGIAWYPGDSWNDESALPTREDYFDVEYDDETDEPSNLAEFPAWATAYITAPDATESDEDRNARAAQQGREAGARDFEVNGDQPHSMTSNNAIESAIEAFSEHGSARAIFASAYVDGYYAALVAADAR